MMEMEELRKPEDRRSPPLIQPKKACFDLLEDEEEASSWHSSDGATNGGIMKPSSIIVESSQALQSTTIKKKSVRFNDEKLEEIIEFEDNEEEKNNRKLFWELVAVDRFRFKERIERASSVLSPVLTSSHRKVVFVQRVLAFENIPLVSVAALAPCSSL